MTYWTYHNFIFVLVYWSISKTQVNLSNAFQLTYNINYCRQIIATALLIWSELSLMHITINEVFIYDWWSMRILLQTSNIRLLFLHPIISLAFPPRCERSKQIPRYIALCLSSIDLRSGNGLWIMARGPFKSFFKNENVCKRIYFFFKILE